MDKVENYLCRVVVFAGIFYAGFILGDTIGYNRAVSQVIQVMNQAIGAR